MLIAESKSEPMVSLDVLDSKNSHWKTIAGAALVVTVLAVSTVLWLHGPDAETKAIGALSADERRTLYERTLRTLETTCDRTHRPRGLDDYCREQAEFVVKFPECDTGCEERAAGFRPLPAR